MPISVPSTVARTMPDDRHAQRVEHADRRRPRSRCRRDVVGEQRLADVEAGRLRRGSRSRAGLPRARRLSAVLCAEDQPTAPARPARAPGRQRATVARPQAVRSRVARTRGMREDAARAARREPGCAPGPAHGGRRAARVSAVSAPAARTSGRPCSTGCSTPRGSAERRLRADVALEDLAVVADLLDDRGRPSPCPGPSSLPVSSVPPSRRCTAGSLLLGLHLVDVGLRDAVLPRPRAARRATSVTIGNHSSSPRRTAGPSGSLEISSGRITWSSGLAVLGARGGQVRGVGGVGLAAAGEEGAGWIGLGGLEHHRLELHAVGARSSRSGSSRWWCRTARRRSRRSSCLALLILSFFGTMKPWPS